MLCPTHQVEDWHQAVSYWSLSLSWNLTQLSRVQCSYSSTSDIHIKCWTWAPLASPHEGSIHTGQWHQAVYWNWLPKWHVPSSPTSNGMMDLNSLPSSDMWHSKISIQGHMNPGIPWNAIHTDREGMARCPFSVTDRMCADMSCAVLQTSTKVGMLKRATMVKLHCEPPAWGGLKASCNVSTILYQNLTARLQRAWEGVEDFPPTM